MHTPTGPAAVLRVASVWARVLTRSCCLLTAASLGPSTQRAAVLQRPPCPGRLPTTRPAAAAAENTHCGVDDGAGVLGGVEGVGDVIVRVVLARGGGVPLGGGDGLQHLKHRLCKRRVLGVGSWGGAAGGGCRLRRGRPAVFLGACPRRPCCKHLLAGRAHPGRAPGKRLLLQCLRVMERPGSAGEEPTACRHAGR